MRRRLNASPGKEFAPHEKRAHRMTGTTQSGAPRRTATTLAAMATLAALLLSGCANLAGPAEETESALQQRIFRAIYEQQVDWQECGPDFGYREELEDYLTEMGAHVEGLRCATILAPLDWDDPKNEQTIELSTLHIPATGDSPVGTLFSNPGGPGASGTELALGLTADEHFAAVHEQYDLIGFDPRGIARSSPIECENETSIFELQLALCADEQPLALSMGTAQVARDMELMRSLVGDESMHYAGFSYGTVIGATYATLFPERVGRILLDSAWPSDWSSPLGGYLQHEANVFATDELLAGCTSEYQVQLCPIGDEAALVQTLLQLDEQPLLAADGTEVDGDMVKGYLTTSLYQLRTGRQEVLDVVGRALAGEQEAIDQLAAAMSGGGAKVGLAGMIVRCLSSPRDPNLAGLYRYITEHGLPQSLGGPEINDDSLHQFFDLKCEALPDSGQDYMLFSNASDAPILVFGVTGDHATPYEGARQLVEELGNATLVTLQGSGHIASFQKRSSCADDIATAYLLRGELPAEDTVCTDD